MQRHRIDAVSLVLGAAAIAVAVAALTGTITVEWVEPRVVASIAALVAVAVVLATTANLVLRRRTGRVATDHSRSEDESADRGVEMP